ncbi:type II secretion system protein GspL [Pseudoduganella violacea]|uniref:General secretion pathway protein L n=1 Tax=Pseudoduganella violacea TaxID=1715466 RepID=A0A7W5BGM4_9BURK|nr:type II secretion system protein GspL [Pseudoduganella violacea]MBB3121875.1 general secretion pathway protein L [Pseudoduganella violacea]
MTTLYIRYPARSAADSGALHNCQFALVGEGGNVMQQGAGAPGNLASVVAGARRVVLLLAASDVSLLRVKVPPLSGARLKAALPGLVEEQVLGDPADCALAIAPAQAEESERTVAVAQRAWLEVLVQAVVAQGAHSVSALPAQLCLPLQPGAVSAALTPADGALELALRQSQYQGLGMTVAIDADNALHTLRALAGDTPITLYLPAALRAQYEPLLANHPGITLEEEHWAHWIAAARGLQLDLALGLSALSGTQARKWQRWRWPLRIAALAVLVNVAGMNIEWLRLKREADSVRQAMTQTFRAAYPKEAVILDPAAQMRKNIALAKANSGEVAPDEFTALSAAFGEALAGLARHDIAASIEYRERSLTVKLKPDSVDANGLAQVKAALAGRKLALTETAPGIWKISAGGKS